MPPPERYLKEIIAQTFPFPSDTKIARYNDEAVHTNKAQAFQAGDTHKPQRFGHHHLMRSLPICTNIVMYHQHHEH